MLQYKVVLKKGSDPYKLYGHELYGHMSRIEPENRCFFILTESQSGLMGQNGIRILFDDCVGVYAEEEGGGAFNKRCEITDWLDWLHTR